MQQISIGTNLFVHHVPGRLRLRAPRLHSDAAEATARAVPGVASAKTNPLTKSLTITYDPRRLAIADLWSALQASLGAPLATIPCPSVAGTLEEETADGPDWADRIADAVSGKVADWLVEWLAERSAMALLAAVL